MNLKKILNYSQRGGYSYHNSYHNKHSDIAIYSIYSYMYRLIISYLKNMELTHAIYSIYTTS